MATLTNKAQWEANMAEWGGYLSTLLQNNPSALAHTFYDSLWVFIQIRGYLNSTSWDTAVQAARVAYRDNYVIPSNGAVPGYWVFSQGLAEDWLKNGDATSKNAVNLLATNAAFAADSAYNNNYLANEFGSRENAYILTAYINNYRCGRSWNTRGDNLKTYALDHLNQWTVAETAPFVRPFMVAITSRALILYSDVFGDPGNTIRDAIATAWDWCWTNCWRSGDTYPSFQYTDIDTNTLPPSTPGYATGGTEASPDLSLLISPVYGWLYLKTGDNNWLTKGDEVFRNGVSFYNGALWSRGAYLGGRNAVSVLGKHVNQNYTWSFDHISYVENEAPVQTVQTITTSTGGKVGLELQARAGNLGGVQVAYCTYTVGQALTAGEVIQVLEIPENAKIIDIIFATEKLDDGGSPTLKNHVGDGYDFPRFIDNSTVGQAGGFVRLTEHTSFLFKYGGDDTIDISIPTGPQTGATNKKAKLAVIYIIE